jgi:hypothetical protein
MRFKAFNARYRLIAPFKQLRRSEEQAIEDTRLILQNAQQLKSSLNASTSWALGKRHIFLSEGIRQQLEHLRSEIRRRAATDIQVRAVTVLTVQRPRYFLPQASGTLPSITRSSITRSIRCTFNFKMGRCHAMAGLIFQAGHLKSRNRLITQSYAGAPPSPSPPPHHLLSYSPTLIWLIEISSRISFASEAVVITKKMVPTTKLESNDAGNVAQGAIIVDISISTAN